MIKRKHISIAATAIAFIIPLVIDKLMDVINSSFMEGGGVTEEEWLPLIASLSGVALIVFISQSGIMNQFSSLVSRIRRDDELKDARQKLNNARTTIKNNLEYLKNQKQKFDRNVDSATRIIDSLNPSNGNFSGQKQQASITVADLKKEYSSNIAILQDTIEQLYDNIKIADKAILQARVRAERIGGNIYDSRRKGPKD
jgi:prefoldin subunit 5